MFLKTRHVAGVAALALYQQHSRQGFVVLSILTVLQSSVVIQTWVSDPGEQSFLLTRRDVYRQ